MDMVLDLVSIMPLFFDADSPVQVMDTGSAVSFVQFMRVLKIFRLLRLRRLLEYMNDEVVGWVGLCVLDGSKARISRPSTLKSQPLPNAYTLLFASRYIPNF